MNATAAALSGTRVLALAGLTFLLMLPETLPVPVLRPLVLDRFHTTDEGAAWFLAANMIGALLAAPLVGLYVDRTGKRRKLAILALFADALLLQLLAHPLHFATFMALRLVEGMAHITALTLLMSLVADAAGAQRGRALGAVGGGLTMGVAMGAALGGAIGHRDPLLALHAASAVTLLAALLAPLVLPSDSAPSRQPGMREVLAAVRAEPALRAPLLLAFVDRFTVGFFTAGFPLLLSRMHGETPPTIGMLLAAFLFPFALLSYPFGRLAERTSRRQLVFWGSALYGALVMYVGAAPLAALWWVMPCCGITSAVMFVPTLLWLLERAPALGKSTVMASFHAVGSLGFLCGPIVCGRIVRAMAEPAAGYTVAFAVAGLAEILGALLVVGLPFAAASRSSRSTS